LPDFFICGLPVCGVGELRLLKESLPFYRFFLPFRLLEKYFRRLLRFMDCGCPYPDTDFCNF
jgi:hypothetical protein